MSTGDKIFSIIGIMLAGIGGGISGHGGNAALDELHRRIDQDIDSQKQNYEHGLHKIRGLESEYAAARAHGLDDIEARRLVQNQVLGAVSLRLKESQAQGAGVGKNDQLQAAITDIDMKRASNDLAMAHAAQQQAASFGHSAAQQAQAHRNSMEEIMLRSALGTKSENAASDRAAAREERDLDKDVTKYGLERKKVDSHWNPNDIKSIEDEIAKGNDVGIGFLGRATGVVSEKAREHRNTIARMVENILRSKSGAAIPQQEREQMERIEKGYGTETELKDFVRRYRAFYDMENEDLDKSFRPEVREKYDRNGEKPAAPELSDQDKVNEARKRLGITGR